MTKILIISNTTEGLYGFRKELIAKLAEDGEVTVLAGDDGCVPELKDLGCRFINTALERHGTNPVKELKLISYYMRLIRKIMPDIVLTYTIKPNVYGGIACSLLNVPYVANITGLGTAVENPGMLQKLTIPLYRLGLRNAQKVFFQNTSNRDFMLEHKMVRGEYDVLPGSGVNVSQYTPMEYPAGETTDFVFISRVMKEKGIEQYLDTAKTIKKKYPNTRFHICGYCEDAYQEELDALNKAGTIVYHGRVKGMEKIYAFASCVIHPTFYPEGMSNVLLESCACARPIITTDRAGCREIVDDGVNGFVVRQRDSADLIEKVEKFLALSVEERKAMGLAGRRKVEREFDRNIVVNKYLDEVSKAKEKADAKTRK